MRVFFIGFGQAGGKLVDMFLSQDKKTGANSFRGIIINTARTDLMAQQRDGNGVPAPDLFQYISGTRLR